jgi:hypothetical protein
MLVLRLPALEFPAITTHPKNDPMNAQNRRDPDNYHPPRIPNQTGNDAEYQDHDAELTLADALPCPCGGRAMAPSGGNLRIFCSRYPACARTVTFHRRPLSAAVEAWNAEIKHERTKPTDNPTIARDDFAREYNLAWERAALHYDCPGLTISCLWRLVGYLSVTIGDDMPGATRALRFLADTAREYRAAPLIPPKSLLSGIREEPPTRVQQGLGNGIQEGQAGERES